MIAAMNTTYKTFWIWLVVVWLWPLVLLLFTFHWNLPEVGLRLLYKSTWVLFAGMSQSWILLLADKKHHARPNWFVPVLVFLSLASLLLLPFGLGKWEWELHYNWDTYKSYQSFELNRYWEYDSNLLLSFAIHFLIPMCIGIVYDGLSLGGYSGVTSYSSSSREWQPPQQKRTGSGPWGEKTWLDDVWKGGQVSDDFIGHRGEFDLNDEARRVSEDMQQFHYNHPDADLSDHYYWEDVLDADTDGYLEEN